MSNDFTYPKEMKFRFKKDKLGSQRPSLEFMVPVPTAAGIVNILETGGKSLDLLLEVMADTIRSSLAGYVSDDENIKQETIPFDKLTWQAIATQPRAERKTIDAEIWQAFADDYLAIMPGLTGKSAETVGNAVTVYLKKFSLIKTNKKALETLKGQLGLYMEHTKKGEEVSEVLELLTGKVDQLLNADDVQQLIENL